MSAANSHECAVGYLLQAASHVFFVESGPRDFTTATVIPLSVEPVLYRVPLC